MATRPLNLRLDVGLYDRLDAFLAEWGETKTAFVAEAIALRLEHPIAKDTTARLGDLDESVADIEGTLDEFDRRLERLEGP